MATFDHIFLLGQDQIITAQISVAITNDAKFQLQSSADPDTLAWAAYAAGAAKSEASKYQLMVCSDIAIADAAGAITDAAVSAAVSALVPTMVTSYKQSRL
jgi:hypothetical protein